MSKLRNLWKSCWCINHTLSTHVWGCVGYAWVRLCVSIWLTFIYMSKSNFMFQGRPLVKHPDCFRGSCTFSFPSFPICSLFFNSYHLLFPIRTHYFDIYLPLITSFSQKYLSASASVYTKQIYNTIYFLSAQINTTTCPFFHRQLQEARSNSFFPSTTLSLSLDTSGSSSTTIQHCQSDLLT